MDVLFPRQHKELWKCKICSFPYNENAWWLLAVQHVQNSQSVLCADLCCQMIVWTLMNLQIKTADFSFRSSTHNNDIVEEISNACIFVFKTQRSINDLIMQDCLTRPKTKLSVGWTLTAFSVVPSPDLMQWKESIKQMKRGVFYKTYSKALYTQNFKIWIKMGRAND